MVSSRNPEGEPFKKAEVLPFKSHISACHYSPHVLFEFLVRRPQEIWIYLQNSLKPVIICPTLFWWIFNVKILFTEKLYLFLCIFLMQVEEKKMKYQEFAFWNPHRISMRLQEVSSRFPVKTRRGCLPCAHCGRPVPGCPCVRLKRDNWVHNRSFNLGENIAGATSNPQPSCQTLEDYLAEVSYALFIFWVSDFWFVLFWLCWNTELFSWLMNINWRSW